MPGGSTSPRRSSAAGPLSWCDDGDTEVPAEPGRFGDVVLARKDAPASYHLAVTVDDAAQGVTDVVRGRDLFASTHVHRLLQALLDLPTPIYHHHALLDRRRRASGSPSATSAPTLADLRAAGADPAALVAGAPAPGELPAGYSLGRGVERRACNRSSSSCSSSPRGATLFVLVKGVIGMAQQKDLTGQRSQELMRKRVLFQAIAILIVVLLLLMASGTEAALVRLNKIYTRTGDAGETGLVDGSRAVQGRRPRMAAIGDVDEANSAIGVALLACRRRGRAGDARPRSRTNCSISAPISPRRARISRPSDMVLRIVPDQIDRLEREIDAMNEDLEPLRSFILPGGEAGAAHLHLARTIVRRAERAAVAAARKCR